MDRTLIDLFPHAIKGLNKDLGSLRGIASQQSDKALDWAKNDLIPAGKDLTKSLGAALAFKTTSSFITRRPLVALAVGVGVCSLAALLLNKMPRKISSDADLH